MSTFHIIHLCACLSGRAGVFLSTTLNQSSVHPELQGAIIRDPPGAQDNHSSLNAVSLHMAQCHGGGPQAPCYRHWLVGEEHRWWHALSGCSCQPGAVVVISHWMWPLVGSDRFFCERAREPANEVHLYAILLQLGFQPTEGTFLLKKEKYQVTETIIQKKLDSSALIRSPLWHRASQRSRVFLCFLQKLVGYEIWSASACVSTFVSLLQLNSQHPQRKSKATTQPSCPPFYYNSSK